MQQQDIKTTRDKHGEPYPKQRTKECPSSDWITHINNTDITKLAGHRRYGTTIQYQTSKELKD